MERSKEATETRSIEISRLRVDVQSQSDLLISLQRQRKQLEEDLYGVRERNREDAQEIDKLNLVNDQRGKESVDLASRIRAIEYDISKALARIDDLNRVID